MGPRKPTIWIAIGLALATLLVFLPACGNGFVDYDDDDYVVNNPNLSLGLTWPGIRWAFTTTRAANWHPLTWLSLMADHQVYGKEPFGYHLTSVLLHGINVVLLYLLLASATGRPIASALVAALFGLHPLHVESVAWIAERKDVLSTLFWLLSIGAYSSYARSGSMRLYGLAIAFFVGGLLAKPMVVTLPFTLLLLDYWPLGRLAGAPPAEHSPEIGRTAPRSLARLLLEKTPFFLLSALSCVATIVAQRSGGAMHAARDYDLPTRLANAVNSYGLYLWKVVWPVNLAVFYPHPSSGLDSTKVASILLLLLLLTAVLIGFGRRVRYLSVGWLWFLGTLVPVIGIVQVGGQAMADRYTYVPLIGVFLILGFGGADLCVRFRPLRWALVPAAALGLLACMGLSFAQTHVWRNSSTLWIHAYGATQNNHMALIGLGCVKVQQGDLDSAVEHFVAALTIKPKSATGQLNLAYALYGQRRPDRAIAHFQGALELRPGWAAAYRGLGACHLAKGEFTPAIQNLTEAIRLEPENALTLEQLALALAKSGRHSEAVAAIQTAVRLKPDDDRLRRKLDESLRETGRAVEEADGPAKAIRRKDEQAPEGPRS